MTVARRPDPVLFHVHGIGPHDFSSLSPAELPGVQAEAERRRLEVVPTIFLRHEWLGPCAELLEAYHRTAERFPRILGFAMEGPMLGPEGGTPRAASWVPTAAEWRRIAALGRLGLRYLVIAPDELELADDLGGGLRLQDLIELLYANSIRVALGHFTRDNPRRSADRALAMIDFIQGLVGTSPFNVLTDHLYNDMPRRFTHAWRGAAAERRERELRDFLAIPWEPDAIDQLLGPVPAALLNATRDGRLMPCMNFDGAHVDLEICRRTVEYLGADRVIAITDHTENGSMAGESLHMVDGSSLWLRDDDIVAAGSQGIEAQIRNMWSIGMTDDEIARLVSISPRAAAGGGTAVPLT